MLLKLLHNLSEGRAPLVEDLGPPDFQKICDIFPPQIIENSRKIMQKCYKFSFLKDFFGCKSVLELETSNRLHLMLLPTNC